MTTTVTMELEDFKYYEECAKAVNAMKANNKFVIIKEHDWREFMVYPGDAGIIELANKIIDLDARHNKLRDKLLEYYRTDKKPDLAAHLKEFMHLYK